MVRPKGSVLTIHLKVDEEIMLGPRRVFHGTSILAHVYCQGPFELNECSVMSVRQKVSRGVGPPVVQWTAVGPGGVPGLRGGNATADQNGARPTSLDRRA